MHPRLSRVLCLCPLLAPSRAFCPPGRPFSPRPPRPSSPLPFRTSPPRLPPASPCLAAPLTTTTESELFEGDIVTYRLSEAEEAAADEGLGVVLGRGAGFAPSIQPLCVYTLEHEEGRGEVVWDEEVEPVPLNRVRR